MSNSKADHSEVWVVSLRDITTSKQSRLRINTKSKPRQKFKVKEESYAS